MNQEFRRRGDNKPKKDEVFGYRSPSSRSRMMLSGDDQIDQSRDDIDDISEHVDLRSAISEYVRYLMTQFFTLRGNRRK